MSKIPYILAAIDELIMYVDSLKAYVLGLYATKSPIASGNDFKITDNRFDPSKGQDSGLS